MTEKSNTYLIHKSDDGGYFVQPRSFDHGMAITVSFAASTIDEALRYIRQKLEPGK